MRTLLTFALTSSSAKSGPLRFFTRASSPSSTSTGVPSFGVSRYAIVPSDFALSRTSMRHAFE
jgi:hypothetical protein